MKKKFFKITACIFFLLAVIGVFITMQPNLPEKPSKERLINFFQNNSDVFNRIAVYLKEIEEDIFINKRDGKDIDSIGKILTKDGVEPFIIDDKVKNDIKKLLYRNGFISIYEERHRIYFDKSVGFQWHQALIYSKDGKLPPQNKVRDFEEIGGGWYYYYGE